MELLILHCNKSNSLFFCHLCRPVLFVIHIYTHIRGKTVQFNKLIVMAFTCYYVVVLSRFPSISEAFASEILGNLEEMITRY